MDGRSAFNTFPPNSLVEFSRSLDGQGPSRIDSTLEPPFYCEHEISFAALATIDVGQGGARRRIGALPFVFDVGPEPDAALDDQPAWICLKANDRLPLMSSGSWASCLRRCASTGLLVGIHPPPGQANSGRHLPPRLF